MFGKPLNIPVWLSPGQGHHYYMAKRDANGTEYIRQKTFNPHHPHAQRKVIHNRSCIKRNHFTNYTVANFRL